MISSKTILVLNVWLLFLPSIQMFENHPNCGRVQDLKTSQRIVGGKKATIQQFPFMAGLRLGGGFKCGASILNNRWILTAAHCVEKEPTSNYTVFTGTANQTQKGDSFYAQLIVINGCFEGFYLKDDIALIKTRELIDVDNPLTRTVCLPEAKRDPSNKKLFHVGWGISQKWDIFSSVLLNMAETELFSEQYCLYNLQLSNIGLFSFVSAFGNKLCVQAIDNQACYGDSGGPLIEVIDGRAVQVGITSHGTGSEALTGLGMHCGTFEPVLYTKVSSYIDWIDAVIKEFDTKSYHEMTIFESVCGSPEYKRTFPLE